MSKTFKVTAMVLLASLVLMVAFIGFINRNDAPYVPPAPTISLAAQHITADAATTGFEVLLVLALYATLYATLYVGLPLLGLYIVVRIVKSAWNR